MSITLNFAQATRLLEAFGGAPAQMTVSAFSQGHSGPGLYVHCADYPEEGSTFLGEADADPGEKPEGAPNRVVITMTDLPDSEVNIAFDFQPALDRTKPQTPVHAMAVCAMKALAEQKPENAGIRAIKAERRRQVKEEGWSPGHDDDHRRGELAAAAVSYAGHAAMQACGRDEAHVPGPWPFDDAAWKPAADPRRNLVKAGALIVAEIERLDRLAIASPGENGEEPLSHD